MEHLPIGPWTDELRESCREREREGSLVYTIETLASTQGKKGVKRREWGRVRLKSGLQMQLGRVLLVPDGALMHYVLSEKECDMEVLCAGCI